MRKKRIFTVAAIAVGLAIAIGLVILMFAGPWRLFLEMELFKAQRAQVRLLSKTDFESRQRSPESDSYGAEYGSFSREFSGPK